MSNAADPGTVIRFGRRQFIAIFAMLVYSAVCAQFFYKYVPRVSPVQHILLLLILSAVVLTALRIEWGTLFMVFLIPVINNLPVFFGISGFNPLIFVFYGYLLGGFVFMMKRPGFFGVKTSLFLPLIGASVIVILSALLTFWRYTNFFPLHFSAVHELSVNVLNVSSGEAIRKVVFDSLNYLAGFIWFLILVNVLQAKYMIRRIVLCLAISTTTSFGFGLYQAYMNMNLGNIGFFIALRRVNAFFSDPNALGVYVSLVVPLFVGSFLFFRRLWKWLFLAALGAGLVLFPHAGSRSGLFGLLIALIVFAFIIFSLLIRKRAGKSHFKQKILAYVSIGVLAVILIGVFGIMKKEGILFERISKSLTAVSESGDPDVIFRSRHLLWPSSFHMIRDFPLSGVGIGAFTSELPNYYKMHDIFPILPFSYYQRASTYLIPIDSAGNFYMHVASELGLVGLIFFMWIFFLILKQIYLIRAKMKLDSKAIFFFAGISSSLVGMIVIFMFGVHTLSFEIQLTFWLIVGLLFVISDPKLVISRAVRMPKKVFIVLCMIFAISYGWNTIHGLSIRERANKFGFEQRFGLYRVEIMEGREFQWSKQKAGISVSVNKPYLRVPVIASHPNIQQDPVRVRISVTMDLFREMKPLDEVVLSNNSWKNVHLDLSEYLGRDALLYFESSRTWNPKEMLGISDPRDLGIGIGELCFISQRDRECDDVETTDNAVVSFSESDWQGRQGGHLYTEGRSWISANLSPGKYTLRISARGEKAGNEWPYMVVLLDDETLGGQWISSDAWKDYDFHAESLGGKHRISVAFVNDQHEAGLQEDRNLFVAGLTIYRSE